MNPGDEVRIVSGPYKGWIPRNFVFDEYAAMDLFWKFERYKNDISKEIEGEWPPVRVKVTVEVEK